MVLSELHSEISRAIARGTSWDAVIPTYARRGCRFIERNFTLQYMKVFLEFTIDAEAANPRRVSLPSGIKKEEFIRLLNDDASYAYMEKIAPQQVTSLVTEQPRAYWLSGTDEIWLSSIPDKDYNAEIYCAVYSTWPTLDAGTHWLLENAEDVILASSVLQIAPAIRLDEKSAGLFGDMLKAGLKTLIDESIELEYANFPMVMQYGNTEN